MRHRIAAALFAALAASAASAAPVQWMSGAEANGHYYELVTAGKSWADARADAAGRSHAGLSGHLATITSQAELDFLSISVNPAATNVWLGGSDAAVEGEWRWVDGPEAGTLFSNGGTAVTFANWNSGEPNNSVRGGVGENALEGWFRGDRWNDESAWVSRAYLVEYSATPVPVPAAAPLLIGALGGLLALRRKR
jgi:hypothetical protein